MLGTTPLGSTPPQRNPSFSARGRHVQVVSFRPATVSDGSDLSSSLRASTLSESASRSLTSEAKRLSQQRSIPKSAAYVKVEGFDAKEMSPTASAPPSPQRANSLLTRQLSSETIMPPSNMSGTIAKTVALPQQDRLRVAPVPRPAPIRKSTIPDGILEQCQARYPVYLEPLVVRAFNISKFAHDGRYGGTGDPVFLHCLAVASTLAELGADESVVAAALLHDVLDGALLLEGQLQPMLCDNEAIELVKKVSHMREVSSKFIASYGNTCEGTANALVSMFVSMDASRALLVTLAAALETMKTISSLPNHMADALAREALDVWSPIANRLGVWSIKAQLEDAAFRHLQPTMYAELRSRLESVQSPTFLVSLAESLRAGLQNAAVSHLDLSARPKHLYGVWKKMNAKGYSLDRVSDVRGLRVIVETKEDCYKALRAVQATWKEVGPLKDYIRNPKVNGYRSLHTVARAPDGHEVEIQIRTAKMHFFAEYGSQAAHWQYKEGGKNGALPIDAKGASWAKFLVSQALKGGKKSPTEMISHSLADLLATSSVDEESSSPSSSPPVLGDARFDAYLEKSGQKPAPPPTERLLVALVCNGSSSEPASLSVLQLVIGATAADVLSLDNETAFLGLKTSPSVLINGQLSKNLTTALSAGDVVEIQYESPSKCATVKVAGEGRRRLSVVPRPTSPRNNMVPLNRGGINFPRAAVQNLT